jgi:hypothetical protein
VVCPVFLFFLLFFSSFFSSASLERKRKKEVRGKVRQEVKIFYAGTLTKRLAPPILSCSEGQRVAAGVRRIRPPASCYGRPRPWAAGWRIRR